MKALRIITVSFLCAAMVFLSACAARNAVPADTEIEYIFVHGLSGWGSYDKTYKYFPYWGTSGGDLMNYLRGEGYACYAASVAPEGSAWDRACELYAQLAGTVVDYGKEHSERCGHERYGRDFSSEPLIPDWDAGKKLVLLGHSFGGVTVRLFAELLAEGSPEEQAVTPEGELSGLFAGGQAERIHALITLAAPTNGTTAYDMHDDPGFDIESVEVTWADEQFGKIFSNRPSSGTDGRASYDYAAFDMHIDNALAINERIGTLPGTYYFAVPCSATVEAVDGTWKPVNRIMEGMFRKSSKQMGAYSGSTAGGVVIDETWRENDGLVNTVSAMAPLGAVSEAFTDASSLEPGIWYVMPTVTGDHMCLQGGMTKRYDIKPFYTELLGMIDGLN